MNALLSHFVRMQSMATLFIQPGMYTQQIPERRILDKLDNGLTTENVEERSFCQDMLYMLDGPEQRAAQAEAEFDYLAETELTASGMDGRHQVTREELRKALTDFIKAGERLDLFKKALFRGRSRANGEIVGLAPLSENSAGLRLSDGAWSKEDIDLLHGIVGVATEAAELADVAVKYLDGETPDKVNVQEEIGDNLWYLARLVKWCGTTFHDEMRRNTRKLRERHGKAGFNVEGDKNRNLGNERVVLETNTDRVRTQLVDFPDDPHCADA